jgi:hypothetical protein
VKSQHGGAVVYEALMNLDKVDRHYVDSHTGLANTRFHSTRFRNYSHAANRYEAGPEGAGGATLSSAKFARLSLRRIAVWPAGICETFSRTLLFLSRLVMANALRNAD